MDSRLHAKVLRVTKLGSKLLCLIKSAVIPDGQEISRRIRSGRGLWFNGQFRPPRGRASREQRAKKKEGSANSDEDKAAALP